jgi:iron complex outermembrane receptor protein
LANTGRLADPNLYPYNQCPNPELCVPVYNYSQQAATFRGYELTMNVPLLGEAWGVVDIDLFSDYTRGQFTQGGNVPRMPPLRYGLQVNYGYEQFEVNTRLTRAQPQNDAGTNEATTPGYVLLNLNAQYRLKSFEAGEVFLFMKANNLLDETIRNSVSYLRNFAPQPGRGAELGLQIRF